MDPASEYSYVVTAQRPTVVTHAVRCRFLGGPRMDLILGRSSHFEVLRIAPDGLRRVVEVPLYGRIAIMMAFRPRGVPSNHPDQLFICTERHDFCVLAWDAAARQIKTVASGTVRRKVHRPIDAEEGPIGLLDQRRGVIGLCLFEGVFQCLTMGRDGKLSQRAVYMRLDELNVVSACFLDTRDANPVLLVLYRDYDDSLHLRTYRVRLEEQKLDQGPWRPTQAPAGASRVIPVGGRLGGAVVVGAETVVYYNNGATLEAKFAGANVEAWERIDDERYLLSDINGNMSLVILRTDGRRVLGVVVENSLGNTSKASTLTYLDNGFVYVGSDTGNSQLIQLAAEPSPADGSYVKLVHEDTNLGPILDFCVVDLQRHGQGMVVCCSGVGKDGSIRAVRNGIGMSADATLDLSGLCGLWALRSDSAARLHEYLVLSFTGETRVLTLRPEGEAAADAMDVVDGKAEEAASSSADASSTLEVLAEIDIPGFDSQSDTLYSGNSASDTLVQVTPSRVRVVGCADLKLAATWTPPGGTRITKASGDEASGLVTVATRDSRLFLLRVSADEQGHTITQAASARVGAEVSSLAIYSSNARKGEGLVAVGTWASRIEVMSLASLNRVQSVALDTGGDGVPRSLVFSRLGSKQRLLCGMGDGVLLNFEVRSGRRQSQSSNTSPPLFNLKRVALGTSPVSLSAFEVNGGHHVMAACDRPTVIYASNNRMLYSNVNLRSVDFLTPFRTRGAPDALAFLGQGGLVLGTADTIQKLDVSTVPLNQQPRRIAHQQSTNTVAVCVEAVARGGGRNAVRIIDCQAFDIRASFDLAPQEFTCSCVSASFQGDATEYYVIGTAFIRPQEKEPSEGRIIVLRYSAERRRVEQIADFKAAGAVYSLATLRGRLVAGINSHVEIFSFVRSGVAAGGAGVAPNARLMPVCKHRGHIIVLALAVRGDYIVVGDLMKSVSLLMYQEDDDGRGTVGEVARDHDPNWLTALAALGENCYLGAEDTLHLFTLRRQIESLDDDRRSVLELAGKYRLGEFVNKFAKGSLVMTLPVVASGGGIDEEDAKGAAAMDIDGKGGSDEKKAPISNEMTHASRQQTQLYATVNGAIGVVAPMSKRQYLFFKKLQRALESVVHGVGGFSHKHFRSYEKNDSLVESHQFIDGDFVEMFMELRPEKMAEVAKRAKYPVQYILRQVEAMARLH